MRVIHWRRVDWHRNRFWRVLGEIDAGGSGGFTLGVGVSRKERVCTRLRRFTGEFERFYCSREYSGYPCRRHPTRFRSFSHWRRILCGELKVWFKRSRLSMGDDGSVLGNLSINGCTRRYDRENYHAIK